MSALFYRLARVLLPRSLRLRLLKYRGAHWATRVVLARAARGTVAGGPFAGLAYGNYSIGSEYFPKLVGSYELELHPLLESLLGQPFRRAVIVGAGEGYYACGLALRCPQLEVVAFETDPAGQECLRAMASRARISSRIEIHGHCTRPALERALFPTEQTLLIMDIEGGEGDLLDPDPLPALRTVTILVELHDCFIPGLRELIAGRFAASHAQELVQSRPRTLADAASLGWPATWPADRFLPLLDEGRPGSMQWLLLTPKATGC